MLGHVYPAASYNYVISTYHPKCISQPKRKPEFLLYTTQAENAIPDVAEAPRRLPLAEGTHCPGA